MTLLAQTIRLGFRIALIWAGGFVLAVAVHALLPDKTGVTFHARHSPVFVPFNRMGFWTCMLAALTVTALGVIQAMLADMGFRPLH